MAMRPYTGSDHQFLQHELRVFVSPRRGNEHVFVPNHALAHPRSSGEKCWNILCTSLSSLLSFGFPESVSLAEVRQIKLLVFASNMSITSRSRVQLT
jgi:hypothetical protein